MEHIIFHASRALRIGVAAFACWITGCAHLKMEPVALPLGEEASSMEIAAPNEEPVVPDPSREEPLLAPGDRAVLARGSVKGPKGQQRSVWIRTIPESSSDSPSLRSTPAARWRYPDLDELLARPSERRPNFKAVLNDTEPVVAANAAIALARLGDASGAETLFRTAETPSLLLPMRCAAIEALGSLPDAQSYPRLSQLLDEYGTTEQGQRQVYVPELHAELVAAVAPRAGATDDPRLLAALCSRSADVRLEALYAWGYHEDAPLPDALLDLRASGDARLRLALIELLLARRHADAQRLLTEAVRDHDLQVRIAAIHGLGSLGGDQSQATLEELRTHHAGRMREAAVFALASMGDHEAVFKSLQDESWRVRAEVARSLSRFQGPDAVEAAEALLEDSSSEVHRELLGSLDGWPIAQSGPIYLKAMGKESFLCRKTATDQLAAQWPPAAAFPIEASSERRQREIERLTSEFRTAFAVQAAAPTEPILAPANRLVTADELAEVEKVLAAEDTAAFVALGPAAMEALEILAIERQRFVPEAIYQEALPEVSREFALLARLETPDVSERRRVAGELAAHAEQSPLSRMAVERLCRLATPEDDGLVFQSVLDAVADHESEAADRIAYAAVGHPSPEVRRRGCARLAAHPNPKHTPVLLPAVDDENASVAAAAVQALGVCGHVTDTDSLIELLRTGNEPLQLEAALALIHLSDPRGIAALERLVYSRDAAVRRRVAEKMGELADPAFTATLVRLLDDRVSVMRAALAALPHTVGEDKSLSADGSPASTTERVRRWKAWFASQ